MEGTERRELLLHYLQTSTEPLSGTALAKLLSVSRQVIVQDIALLRATNQNILSTARGYLLYQQKAAKVRRCFSVCHTTAQIKDELCTMVDRGGTVLDVIVEHPIYGTIHADLLMRNRRDVLDFVKKVETKQSVPLKELTNDCHLHTVEADNETILDEIELALKEKGYLVSDSPS